MTGNATPLSDQLRALVSAVEDLEADAGNDFAYAMSAKRAHRELRALFAEYGVCEALNWPEWIAAIRARLERRP